MAAKGLYFDDFLPGGKWNTDKRTITESDLVNFTTAFGFFEPLFMDETYLAESTTYEGRLVPGAMTFAVAEGLTILSGIIHGTGVAFLGTEMTVLRPVVVGDTLGVDIEVMEKRETKNPERGIVTFLQRVSNQHGLTVMEYAVKRMIRRH